MLFLAFALFAVVLTVMSFMYKNVALSIISALAWFGMGIYQMGSYYDGAGILLKYITGMLGFLMGTCMIIAPIMFMRKPKAEPEAYKGFYESEFKDDFRDITEAYEARAAVKKFKGVKRRR
jgi:hypothetical protein